MALKTRKRRSKKRKGGKSPRKRKLSLKRSVKKFGKMILKHLVEEPEKERERTIATLEREVSKKFKRMRERK